jgi:hypothetical protein
MQQMASRKTQRQFIVFLLSVQRMVGGFFPGVSSCVSRDVMRKMRGISTISMTQSPCVLEVETKFAVLDGDEIEEKLLNLGMIKENDKTMVDWYFDLPAPNWILTPQDCWLRFRETPKGSSWQLKRGRNHEGGATVYEEFEGMDAIEIALSILPKYNDSIDLPITESDCDSYQVPKFPDPSNLVPFARIETRRSSWEPKDKNSPYTGLIVDLDGTDFGYTVGEVETVVNSEEDVEAARQRVSQFVNFLAPDSAVTGDSPAIGKLEYYMVLNRQDQYEACVHSGSIVSKSVSKV